MKQYISIKPVKSIEKVFKDLKLAQDLIGQIGTNIKKVRDVLYVGFEDPTIQQMEEFVKGLQIYLIANRIPYSVAYEEPPTGRRKAAGPSGGGW